MNEGISSGSICTQPRSQAPGNEASPHTQARDPHFVGMGLGTRTTSEPARVQLDFFGRENQISFAFATITWSC